MKRRSSSGQLFRLALPLSICTIAAALVLFFATGLFRSHAGGESDSDEPGSEGRVITPAGELVMDVTTNLPAVGALPVDLVRSPDGSGPDGKGRYLLSINSGYGVQFDTRSSNLQSVAVIDLNANPVPAIIQNVYFPDPQSANFGIRFHSKPEQDGSYRLFVSGGFENKIWMFRFSPGSEKPVSPASEGRDADGIETRVTAQFIDVSAFADNAPTPNYNSDTAAVYPTGIALSPDGESVYSANNLGDSLGIVSDLRDTRAIKRVSLRREDSKQFVYPYDVEVIPAADGKTSGKAFVSLWGDASVAVVDLKNGNKLTHIPVDRHPTAMVLNEKATRLFVVNSNADSVSVIDTGSDSLVERIDLKLSETEPVGGSPEGLALSDDEKTLYVANAHANAVAVVALGDVSRGEDLADDEIDEEGASKLLGFIPTGQYASAVAVIGRRLFIANGKGTGVENSSTKVNNSGRVPNAPNERFPKTDRAQGGQYSASVVVGNISHLAVPNERELFGFTQSVMRNNGLIGKRKTSLFKGRSPIKHVIYIIKENRTYDQLYGDLEASGDGTKADGDPSLAIFGAGETARSPGGEPQKITPNQRALAMRFGLFDRFFVNAEASPDGHNWSTAAFSNDYVDKAFRWNYSGRGRTYDYEGFNRLPSYEPPGSLPPVFKLPVDEDDVADYMKRFVPYLQDARDIAEPETLYLWDAAERAGLTYRNYGEFIGTISEDDLREINTRERKMFPDVSKTLKAFATKESLEGHFNPTFRNYDLMTPDIMTPESYRAAKESAGTVKPEISEDNPDERFRGNSRFGEWVKEFRAYANDLKAGRGDHLPNLSIVRFSNDHTSGWRQNVPTPQFYVAENDYAVGRLVEEVSNSPYWKDTAIFIVEDDAQAGPDHVDAHRSPALVISAYNRKGILIHDFHNTVSLIRTMELLLGIPPMNLLDSTAVPMDIFGEVADLTPFKAVLPNVAFDNLFPPARPTAEMRAMMRLTDKQDLVHADMANPGELNRIIWFSVRGAGSEMPGIAQLPAFSLMTQGLVREEDEEDEIEDAQARSAKVKRLLRKTED